MTLTPEQIEHRRLWTDDLRNGGHEQVQGFLEVLGVGFCCHGRACRVAMAHGIDLVVNRVATTNEAAFTCVAFDREEEMPPPAVYDWLGLDFVQAEDLASMNDTGSSFAEIADKVDEWTAAGR